MLLKLRQKLIEPKLLWILREQVLSKDNLLQQQEPEGVLHPLGQYPPKVLMKHFLGIGCSLDRTDDNGKANSFCGSF